MAEDRVNDAAHGLYVAGYLNLGSEHVIINLGFTEDSLLNALPAEAQEIIRQWLAGHWTPMERLDTPADIGNVVALLCSDDAAWITGQLITADGGASLMNAQRP